MWTHNQGQDIAEGTFVKFQNPSIDVDNYKSQLKKQINDIPYMLLKKAKKSIYFGNFFYKSII